MEQLSLEVLISSLFGPIVLHLVHRWVRNRLEQSSEDKALGYIPPEPPPKNIKVTFPETVFDGFAKLTEVAGIKIQATSRIIEDKILALSASPSAEFINSYDVLGKCQYCGSKLSYPENVHKCQNCGAPTE